MAEVRDYPTPELVVSNVVCVAYVDSKLPLILLVESLKGRYDPSVFPPVVTPCKETRITASVFESGKIVIAGAKSIEHGLFAGHFLVKKIRRDTGILVNLFNFQVHNIVAATDIGHKVDIYKFRNDNQNNAEYNPENFPGLRWFVRDEEEVGKNKFAFTVYQNGKAICAGLKSMNQLEEAEKLMDVFHFYTIDENEQKNNLNHFERRKKNAKNTSKKIPRLRELSKNRKDTESYSSRIMGVLSTKTSESVFNYLSTDG